VLRTILAGGCGDRIRQREDGVAMSECPNLPSCGFMKAFGTSKSLVCQGFVVMFCRGERQQQCQRKAYKAAHGAPPPDNMMPDGHMLAS
jgi:hypothetical protein